MALFGTPKKVRRPVAKIVAGLTDMVSELEESNIMAADEQKAAEKVIIAKQAERKLLLNEQAQAGSIITNLSSLLGLDLDGDGEVDDLDRAIAALGDTSTDAVAESDEA